MKKLSYYVPLLSLLIISCLSLWIIGCDNQPVEPTPESQVLSKKGGIPSEGNDNKLVFSWDETWTVTCDGGAELTRNDVGWAQVKYFYADNNKNLELDVFHIVITYTNENGDKFIWRDVGPDKYYLVGDELFVSISGRSTGSGNIDRTDINVGHVVLNLSTGEVVLAAGQGLGPLDDLACEKLN